MSRREFDAEQKAEELLAALGQELGESRAAFAEALMNDETPDPPMFSEQKPPTKSSISARKPRRKRRLLLLAAALVLLLGVLVVSTEGVKLKNNTLHLEDTPNESAQIIDESNAVYDVADFYMEGVPKGYELVEDVQPTAFMRKLRYEKDDISINVFIIKTESYGSYVDNERMAQETVLVNDREAYLFQDEPDLILVWQMGDCTVDIATTASREDLLEIGKHLFVK